MSMEHFSVKYACLLHRIPWYNQLLVLKAVSELLQSYCGALVKLLQKTQTIFWFRYCFCVAWIILFCTTSVRGRCWNTLSCYLQARIFRREVTWRLDVYAMHKHATLGKSEGWGYQKKNYCRCSVIACAAILGQKQSCSSLVPRPQLQERVWWHPADTSGFINIDYYLETNFSPSITLQKRQSVVQHPKFLATSARWCSTFFGT